MPARRPILSLALVVFVAASLASCADGGASAAPGGASLRLGYLPNVTHAVPIVGVANGTFDSELEGRATLEPRLFNSGPALIEALFAGELDAAYIGPNPAINGFVRSNGEAVRVIAGAATGGSALVVRPDAGITSPDDFAGKRVATPQLGNTQDVALRTWLGEHGLEARDDGGNVYVLPMSGGDAFSQFQLGTIDAAWMAEPWVSRLVVEAGGELYLDERELWPDGKFATTLLIVRPDYLEDHPEAVEALLRGHLATIDWIAANDADAKDLASGEIKRITTVALPAEVVDAAWETITFTYDPVAASLEQSAADAFELGFLGAEKPDIRELLSIEMLRQVLAERGLPLPAGAS